jgi:hypothetical protein
LILVRGPKRDAVQKSMSFIDSLAGIRTRKIDAGVSLRCANPSAWSGPKSPATSRTTALVAAAVHGGACSPSPLPRRWTRW